MIEGSFLRFTPVEVHVLLHQGLDGLGELGKVRHEAAELVDHTHERSHFGHIGWGREIFDRLDFLWVRRDATVANDVAGEGDLMVDEEFLPGEDDVVFLACL